MKLSFLPGKLLLDSAEGLFRITIDGQEVFQSHSQKAAVKKFNAIRDEMERRFPASEDSDADRAEALNRMLLDFMVGHNSLGGRKKKTTAGGTRTFGG